MQDNWCPHSVPTHPCPWCSPLGLLAGRRCRRHSPWAPGSHMLYFHVVPQLSPVSPPPISPCIGGGACSLHATLPPPSSRSPALAGVGASCQGAKVVRWPLRTSSRPYRSTPLTLVKSSAGLHPLPLPYISYPRLGDEFGCMHGRLEEENFKGGMKKMQPPNLVRSRAPALTIQPLNPCPCVAN